MLAYGAYDREKLGKALKLNKTLIHIDLSSNDFSSEACKFIGKRLKKNHTLTVFTCMEMLVQ
jgi:Ran GTPase-activating protein (RanGAP) involved in mRNA processing and transport